MQKIAITGNMGTGKSVAGDFLRQKGEKVLDLDDVTAELYSKAEIRDLIQDRFGLEFFTDNGQVERRKFAAQIFASPVDRRWLERVFWPRIYEQMQLWFYKQEKRGAVRVFVIAPLLFEAGWQTDFTEIWLVTATVEEILTRLQIRDHLTNKEAKKRLQTQKADTTKLGLVTVVLHNNRTQADLQKLIVKKLTKT